MNPVRRRALVAAALMCGTAVLAKVAKPSIKLADQSEPIDLEAIFPADFGRWQVDRNMPVILPAPDVQAKLNAIYNQVLSRTYVNDQGYRVMLSVAYGGDQSDGMNVHLPEVCYPAQGFQVADKRAGLLELGVGRSIAVHRLVTRLGGRHEPVTYWVTVGESVAPSRTQQKLAQIGYGLRGQIPDGMLVRVSSIDRDTPQAMQIQAQFVNEMSARIPERFRARVIGKAE